MENRTIMNSFNLKTIFAQDYEDFFLHHNLVISVPHIINLGCIYNKDNENQQIRQKIPSKMFLGINMYPGTANIIYKDIKYFSSVQNKFIVAPIHTIFDSVQIEKSALNVQEKLSTLKYNNTIEIDILSENEKGSGIEFCSIFPILLSTAIHILTGKTSLEEMNSSDEFLNSESFESIYRTTRELSQGSKSDINGITIRTAMEYSPCPMISQKITEDTDKKQTYNINLANFFHIPKNQDTAIVDYGILNFGTSYDESYINTIYENIKKNHTVKEQDAITKVSNNLSNKLIKAWRNIFKFCNDQEFVDEFISTIGQQGLFMSFLEKEYTVFADVISLFHKTKQFQDEKIGLTTLTSNKDGGSFLFVINHRKSRETMRILLQQLQENGYNNAQYQYISWLDGATTEGLKIEQYINKNLYSAHIKGNNSIMEACNGEKIIGNHRDLIQQYTDCVIFDNIDGKIYINKEPTNHTEILTQSGTIEVINLLFAYLGTFVNNTKLPPSSYSKNKNEMVGKIIGPLQDLMQKKFNEKLSLDCSGNIVDFDLRLTPNKIPLYLLKKIC